MRPGKSLLMYLCSKFILSPPCHHLLDLVRLHRDELRLVGLCGARLRGRRRPPRCHLARSPTPQPEPQPHIPLLHHGDRPPQLPKLSVPLPDCVGAAASPRAASPNRPSAADAAGSAAPPLFPVGFDSAARAARFPDDAAGRTGKRRTGIIDELVGLTDMGPHQPPGPCSVHVPRLRFHSVQVFRRLVANGTKSSSGTGRLK